MTPPRLLPGPTTDNWDWQLHGCCREEDAELFYHPDGERRRARTQREHRAKTICRACPVLSACREYALTTAEPYGIWGGLGETERQQILRDTRRQ